MEYFRNNTVPDWFINYQHSLSVGNQLKLNRYTKFKIGKIYKVGEIYIYIFVTFYIVILFFNLIIAKNF